GVQRLPTAHLLPTVARTEIRHFRLKGSFAQNTSLPVAAQSKKAIAFTYSRLTTYGMCKRRFLQMNPQPASMFAFPRPSCKTDARCCRILPLSPRLCISTIMESPVYRKVVTTADLAEPPKAWITYHRIVPDGVKLRFVFSRVASSGVAALVKKYGDYS